MRQILHLPALFLCLVALPAPFPRVTVLKRSGFYYHSLNQRIKKIYQSISDPDDIGYVKSYEFPGYPGVKFHLKEVGKDEDSTRHKYILANLVVQAIESGFIRKGSLVCDASYGDSARHLSLLFLGTGVDTHIVVPENVQIGFTAGTVKRGPRGKIHKMAEEACEEARQRGKHAFFLNSFGRGGMAQQNLLLSSDVTNVTRIPNMFEEAVAQIRKDGNVDFDYFVATIGSGATVTSAGNVIREKHMKTKLVAVDTQYSSYYDYVVSGRHEQYERQLNLEKWFSPGIIGFGSATEGPLIFGYNNSLRTEMIDVMVKIPDISVVAMFTIMKELQIVGGPLTAANLLASLSVAGDREKRQEMNILTLQSDIPNPYDEFYMSRNWIESAFAKHGGLEAFDCWSDAIRLSMESGMNPVEESKRLQCHLAETKASAFTNDDGRRH